MCFQLSKHLDISKRQATELCQIKGLEECDIMEVQYLKASGDSSYHGDKGQCGMEEREIDRNNVKGVQIYFRQYVNGLLPNGIKSHYYYYLVLLSRYYTLYRLLYRETLYLLESPCGHTYLCHTVNSCAHSS